MSDDTRILDAAHWICEQLSVWFSEDGRSAIAALAHAVGLIARDVSGAGDNDAWLATLTPATLSVLRALEEKKMARGDAIGALGGAILYLAKPHKEERDDPS